MKKKLLVLIFSICSLLNTIEPHFMTDPAISPDGETVCFSYMSDLWIVPFKGGEAKRITTTKGDDWNPVFSPDGKKIAFNTERDGWGAIYIIPAEGGIAEPINKEDLELLDWFPDGKSLLEKADEPGIRNKLFRVNLDGSFQEITAFGGKNASVSKDGKKIIFDRGGMVYREAYKGSFNGDIWEYNIKSATYSRLAKTELTEQYPVYSSISGNIY
ncbi:MAG: PD40 domain-containing protein, partial [Candidatus Cloacimonetes bacterium]|nr:PD40 domain-containing protein [Candidatus Cloacimonadota bacterium]